MGEALHGAGDSSHNRVRSPARPGCSFSLYIVLSKLGCYICSDFHDVEVLSPSISNTQVKTQVLNFISSLILSRLFLPLPFHALPQDLLHAIVPTYPASKSRTDRAGSLEGAWRGGAVLKGCCWWVRSGGTRGRILACSLATHTPSPGDPDLRESR